MRLTGFVKGDTLRYDGIYESRERREEAIQKLLDDAKSAKSGTEQYFQKMRSYYDGTHLTQSQTGQFIADAELPWKPATVPDGYMHVESQIDAEVPDFEFSGRDGGDEATARMRESIVRYVCEHADLKRKNAMNERRLNLYGTAIFKLSVTSGALGAEVGIDDISPEAIYPDPMATEVDDCEYIACIYTMSIMRAERVFGRDLARLGTTALEIASHGRGDADLTDDIEVVEWWYRQPCDGEGACEYTKNGAETVGICKYRAGDIAFSILLGGREIRNVPRFWDKTGIQSFPFVIYCKTPRDGSIWGKSEIEAIIPMIDAADRQLAFAQLNTAFASNDVVVCEENAFANDSYPKNSPGAVWRLRPGMIDKVKRLGGLTSDNIAHYEIMEKYRTLMKDALGNYDYLQGSNTSQVTTATGLALLSDQAGKRMSAKKVCKKAGFERLYRLIDYLALEIYDEEALCRMLGGGDDVSALLYGGYIPHLDVTVNIGDGIENSRSFTLSALCDLISMDIDEENYPIARAYISALGIPERASICERLDKKYKYEEER